MRRWLRPALALTVLLLGLAVVELGARALVAVRTPEGVVFDPELIYDLTPSSALPGAYG